MNIGDVQLTLPEALDENGHLVFSAHIQWSESVTADVWIKYEFDGERVVLTKGIGGGALYDGKKKISDMRSGPSDMWPYVRKLLVSLANSWFMENGYKERGDGYLPPLSFMIEYIRREIPKVI